MTLVVGHIAYANCAPFFHYLADSGFRGRIVRGVPAALNRLLAEGEIDVSPTSSFEYARAWRDYLLLPGHSISSCGPVRSVLLFSPRPLEELEGSEIAITGESGTSVNLLRVLLAEFYGLHDIRYVSPEPPVEALIAADRPALLIGDRALRAARAGLAPRVFDLGELWLRHTGLPFVFGLWILRRQAAAEKRREVLALQRQLAASRRRAFVSLEQLAAESPEREWMGEAGLVDYWRAMSYDLGEEHLAGLRLFFELSVRRGLLAEMPRFHFFE
jgi:chorismate dehydratase